MGLVFEDIKAGSTTQSIRSNQSVKQVTSVTPENIKFLESIGLKIKKK